MPMHRYCQKTRLFWQVLAVLLVCLNAPGIAASGNDLATFLKARDGTVSDYSISTREAVFSVDDALLATITQRLDSLGAPNTTQEMIETAVEEIIEMLSGKQTQVWVKSIVHRRGKQFKSVRSTDNDRLIQQYDGSRYVFFDPASTQQQADIYAKPQPNVVFDFEYLSITLDRPTQLPVMEESSSDDHFFLKILVDEKSRKTASLTFNREFALKYVLIEKEGQPFGKKWLYGHSEVGDLQVPTVVCMLSELGDTHELQLVFIDKVTINEGISENDLALKIPPSALIVDHRVHPPSVYRFTDIIESAGIKKDDIDLDMLDLDIPNSPPASDPTAPQPAYENLHPGVEAHGVADEHEEKPVVEESPRRKMIVFVLAALGCVLIAAYFVVVITRKAKRRSGPGGAGKASGS